MQSSIPANSPFSLDNDSAYQRWRDAKLKAYPQHADELVVEVGDPRRLTASEHAALLAILQKTNMVIYASPCGRDPDKEIVRQLGRQFGLHNLDSNLLADDDGITSITVQSRGDRAQYIPYTNKPLKWHTDGYYNRPERQIRGMLLHCVQAAGEGGENGLLDPEIAYIWLRDENPGHVHLLMQPDVMTIPPGKDGEGESREAVSGPVFSWHAASSSLHMRYTARQRNIEWNAAANTAAGFLVERMNAADNPYCFHARLQSGMGLLCNNVLHDRAAFTDTDGLDRRLLYRARYFDRIHNT